MPPYNTEGRDGSSGEGKLYPRTTYFTEDEWKQEGAGAGSLDRKPMLVVLHGLSGGSHEVYLRHVIAPLVPHGTKDASSSPVIGEAEGGSGTRTEETTDQGLGWEVIVLNARGCARSKITSNILFNARATWDVRQMVSWLREKFPNRPLFGIGFSLGANILTNVSLITLFLSSFKGFREENRKEGVVWMGDPEVVILLGVALEVPGSHHERIGMGSNGILI